MSPDPTPLTPVQASAGAKLIDFHGWHMPVQFAGIRSEHEAVRQHAGLFDLCHMGRLHLSGPDALPFLEQRLSRHLADLQPGRVRYALVLAADGTVEDDVLVSRESDEAFHLVVNAGNRAKLLQLWQPSGACRLVDRSAEEAMLAIQGPAAWDLLADIGLADSRCKRFAFVDQRWRNASLRLSRTGYTGEDGAECFGAADTIVALWQALHQAGASPCGLGARDTLRLEAAMPLYGQELSRRVTPLQAGLAFACAQDKSYIGSEALAAERSEGLPRRLIGLRMRARRVPRTDYTVLHHGREVGWITSGTLSPTLDSAIAMAYVDAGANETGTELHVDIRGKAYDAEVVDLPFYRRRS